MINHEKFISRLHKQEDIYNKILTRCEEEMWMIDDPELFYEVLENFGPILKNEKAQYDLMTIYQMGFHRKSGTLIISNVGATLYSLAPRTQAPYITRHIGLCLYIPEHGTEMVNVGLVGNVYEGPVVLRTESACTPSFVFGSQRCNCAHQWDVFREVAAHFNPVTPSSSTCGTQFEKWVQTQFSYCEGKHRSHGEGQGFIMMHIDTQNGMGSGYTHKEYASDLYTRASLRHRGEYTSEQVWQTTMKGGFEAIGIEPDPRKENNGSGYRVTPIVLDYLNVSKQVVMLTNNTLKMDAMKSFGYEIFRIKSIGEVAAAGAKEAYERGVEFSHIDIDSTHVSFNDEFKRLCSEITHSIALVKDQEAVTVC